VEMVTKFQKISRNPTYIKNWAKRNVKGKISKKVHQFLTEMTKYKKDTK
jgi:hypothetical protein